MIKNLYIKPEKGKAPLNVPSVTLMDSKGIEGDCHAGGDGRDVCLINEKTLSAIDGYKEKFNCLAKFSPNIVLSGSRTHVAGDRISVNGCVLTVTSVGRECHHLCSIPDCPLIHGIIFASVTKGGKIRIGDFVSYD